MKLRLPSLTSDEVEHWLGALPVPVLGFLREGYLGWANRAGSVELKTSLDDLLGRRPDDLPLRGPLSDGMFVDGARYVLLPEPTNGPSLHYQASIRRASGGVSLVVLLPLRPTAAEVVAFDEQFRRRERAGPVSQVDPTSGLLDRESIRRLLDGEVSRSRRYDNPLSIVFVEVELEPGTGPDEADPIVAASQRLLEQTRWADNIGRWDAHRLLLVLPETGADAGEALLEKLRDAMADLPLRFALAQWRRGDDTRLVCRRALDQLPQRGSAP